MTGARPETGELRVACLQMEPRVGDPAHNLARSSELIRTAAAGGARLMVLPELCNSGYVFHDPSESAALAEPFPGGRSCTAWEALCAELDLYLVAGVCERDGDAVYNSAVVIGPGGHIGTYRKLHVWDGEHDHFRPGDRGLPVFDLPIGRIAMIVCYDTWFPESFRAAAEQDAAIVCIPTNWLPYPSPVEPLAMANVLCVAGAHVNALYVATASRVGTERGQAFIGQSVVVDPDGRPIAGPAGEHAEEILYADVDLRRARAARRWNATNDRLDDRRRDVYGGVWSAAELAAATGHNRNRG